MATGRPSLLSMACGLLMYPVYVAQVQQQLHTKSNNAYVHVVFRTQFIHTYMFPRYGGGFVRTLFSSMLIVFMTAHNPKASSCLPALCTKRERLPAYVCNPDQLMSNMLQETVEEVELLTASTGLEHPV